MSSNQILLQKADLALADLSANGGLLMPEQGAAFIRKLIKEPTLIKEARVVEMAAPQRKINKIGFANRILRKAQSGVALTQAQRAKPGTEHIMLSTQEVMAEVRLPNDVLEDNIERAVAAGNEPSNSPWSSGLQETLVTLIAERAALDLEELCLLGDTAYTNPGNADDQAYLSMFDGWLKLAGAGHVVNWANAAIAKEMFKKGMTDMPVQYLRNKAAMRHFVSVNQETEYRDTLANRVGVLGDLQVQTSGLLSPYGVPMKSVQLMPEALGLFTNPLNLIFGIQRQISLEFDKNISERVYIVVLTARVAVQVEETDAIVKYTNIGTV